MEEEKKDLETQAPETGEEKTSENQTGENQEDKTSEKNEPSVETLLAQKEHQRKKREEAEARAQALEEELAKLKEASALSGGEFGDETDWEDDPTKKIRQIEKELLQIKEENKWREDYSSVLKFYPQLSKKEDEFKEFAYRKENRSVPLKYLAQSFLFENKELMQEKKEEEPKRKGLEKPSGSGPTPETEMSLEDINRLRMTQPRRYEELVIQGKIKIPPVKK